MNKKDCTKLRNSHLWSSLGSLICSGKNSCKCSIKLTIYLTCFDTSLCQNPKDLRLCLEWGRDLLRDVFLKRAPSASSFSRPQYLYTTSQIPRCLIISLYALLRCGLLKTRLTHNRMHNIVQLILVQLA